MARTVRRGFTAAEKTEMWDRWQRGESLKSIILGDLFIVVGAEGSVTPPASLDAGDADIRLDPLMGIVGFIILQPIVLHDRLGYRIGIDNGCPADVALVRDL